MTDRDWVLLKTIAEERNITRAAEKLYISQPAITYRVRLLEREFAAKLLIRTPNGVILTPQGEHLLNYAKEMLLLLAKTKERLAGFEGRVRGPLRIGSSAVFANYRCLRCFTAFGSCTPKRRST
jgi:DNA-binding transcriptional LysR family regulator